MGTPSSTCPPTFDITPSVLLQRAEIAADRIRSGVTHLVESISPQQVTFDNAIRPLAEIDNDVKSSVQYMALFQAVSPSPDLHKASSAAVSIIDKAYLALFQHEGLFALVDAAYGNSSRSQEDVIDEEDRRLLDRFYRMFVDNGIKLVGPARERYIWISRRLVDLRVAFMENLSSDPGYVWKAEHELQGVSLDTLERDQRDPNSLFRISLARPSVNSILANCHDANTRAEIFLKSQTIYQEKNVPVFREIMILRDEAARLLGFPSFATQKLRQQLVKSPDKVCSLLDELDLALQPMAQQELQVLQQVLEKPLRLSDFDFQHNQLLKEKYHVDQELVAEYFPAKVTVRRMLNIFETLFALAIRELDNLAENRKWHPDVTAYEVWEADIFIGYLYVDIYPRPGKYNHAANFNIYPSYVGRDGKRTSVASALVCNVSRNSDDQPALLRHREVITIFHELGHGIHDLLGKSKYAMFHGHRTVSDFSEAPSQLLEYWCWVPECLRRLSCHYSYLSPEYLQHWKTANAAKDALQPPMEIPDEIVHNLVAAKQLNQGILTLRQVAFSKFDMKIHNPASHDEIKATDFSKLYNSLLQDKTGLQGPQDRLDWGSGYATSSHYIWGQEANYYSYLYTRILAADIWYTHFQSSPLSQDAGLRYRKMILDYGGSQDEWKLLTSFLGRDPTIQPYLRDIGAITCEDNDEEKRVDRF